MRSRPRSITRLVGMLLGLGALIALTGCGSQNSGPATSNKAQAAGSASTQFPRTVKHKLGNSKIPERPQRIVALDPSFIDNALQLRANVVGYATYRPGDDALPGYLGKARQTYAGDAESVGTIDEPNLEKIAKLKPDLILSAEVRHGDIYDQLSSLAPTVMPETTGATWKQNLLLTGRAVGKEKLAKQQIAKYEERAAKIGAAINAQHNDPTISVVRFVDGPARLYAKDNYSGVVLDDAGLARPKPQNVDEFALDISEERIPEADADHIFVTTYTDDGPSATQAKERFQRNPLWGKLSGKIHPARDELWMTPCSLQGAHKILDDLAQTFNVDPQR